MFSQKQQQALSRLAHALIDQKQARVLIPPNKPQDGFWFGGGDLAQDTHGVLWLVGRYRNFGDSRTGLHAGERGLECALFRSDDGGTSFTKVRSWSKADLSYDGRDVLSIEGTSLHQLPDGTWELFVSSEKKQAYPADITDFQKPGTGVWSLDRMTGAAPDTLDAETLQPVLSEQPPAEYLHVKDPVVYDAVDGSTHLIFCTHPFTWAASNSGLAVRQSTEQHFHVTQWQMVARGAAWDVAATRITGHLPVPAVGMFVDANPVTLYFYDGAESMRSLEANSKAVVRPRGYSCEEIAATLMAWRDNPATLERMAPLQPMFTSPYGSGSSRYIKTLVTSEGIWATWQQSQADHSQALAGRFLPMTKVKQLLGG